MLRLTMNSSVGGAKSYFRNSDYLSHGQELQGRWGGRGAAMLGLSGPVDQHEWDLLCENRDPRDGESLAARRNADRRVGYDFTFSPGKSLSLLYAVTRDQRLLEAFHRSVDQTMLEMEQEMQTRVRRSGKNEDRTTGNMVWGSYTHFTSRPVNGTPDPHLHTHCFVFNTTWDSSENRWKAGQFGDIKRDAHYYEAVFESKLASEITALGLPVVRTRTGWELDGLDKSTLKKFSRRTELIEKMAEDNGITSEVEKSELGAKTREKKQKQLSMSELQQQWKAWLTNKERNDLAGVIGRIGGAAMTQSPRAAEQSIEHAISHCFERESVVPERTLLREALRHSYGQASREAVENRSYNGELIRATISDRDMVTTQTMLDKESEVIRFARDTRGTRAPLVEGGHKFHRNWLSEEQRAAVRHIVGSSDQVILLRGAAGVGKTTLISEAVEAIESNGRKVFAFAPSAGASRGVLRDEGFKDADTVARLLVDQKLQQKLSGQVILIDEAGLLGINTIRQVFELAERSDARIILSGDRRQHHSVEAGDALALLETEAGLIPAEVLEIRRQKGQYLQAVRALSEGRVEDGFRQLEELGAIKELPDDVRYHVLADDYLDSVQRNVKTLVVCPTHIEGGRVSDHIRSRLKEAGVLGEEERQFTRLVKMNLTAAERGDAVNLLDGNVVIYHQNAKGHRKGETLVVGDQPISLEQAERYTVYRRDIINIAVGDTLRITKNVQSGDGRKLNNGDAFTVRGFTEDGGIQFTSGATLAGFESQFLAHGYVVTSHSSQGKSISKVIVAESGDSFGAASREQFYVTISRGKNELSIYTHDKDSLLDAVSRSDRRMSALDLIAERECRVRSLETARTNDAPSRNQSPRKEMNYER
jgi:conjugative relaxase-like TrwC/TraI family protein